VIAGVPLVCAGGAWLSGDPLVLRGVTAAAAVAAVVGAVVMRRWDRLAGKQVAELNRGAASERWRHEEAVAELEGDLEESRELRTRLEGKLRAKRAELAALRNEHAALLRRYANAETGRASALEGRRQLAIESAAPAKALPPVGARPPGTGVSPELYRRASAALDRLTSAPAPVAEPAVEGTVEGADGPGKSTAASGHYTVPAAATVAPPAPSRRALPGGFDYFGRGEEAAPKQETPQTPETQKALETPERPVLEQAPAVPEDLADVVGEEALAERPEPEDAGTEVIDLTAHDETEQLDVVELRSALRA
jgi:hypothetical protein